MIAACNQWLEWDELPVRYVRDGEHVLVEARYNSDEPTDSDLFWIDWYFDKALMNVPWEIQVFMESLHFEDDDDCWCDPCTAAQPDEWTPEELQSYLEMREGRFQIYGSADDVILDMIESMHRRGSETNMSHWARQSL